LDSICLLKSIVIVNVSGCSNVTKFPSMPGNTRYLYLSETAVEEFPSSAGHLWRIAYFYKLVELHLRNCTKFEILPGSTAS